MVIDLVFPKICIELANTEILAQTCVFNRCTYSLLATRMVWIKLHWRLTTTSVHRCVPANNNFQIYTLWNVRKWAMRWQSIHQLTEIWVLYQRCNNNTVQVLRLLQRFIWGFHSYEIDSVLGVSGSSLEAVLWPRFQGSESPRPLEGGRNLIIHWHSILSQKNGLLKRLCSAQSMAMLNFQSKWSEGGIGNKNRTATILVIYRGSQWSLLPWL